MDLWKNYDVQIPDMISRLPGIPEMIRLKHVGMNCGCEYTSFPLFRSMKERYTRYDHSMGAALLVWRFSEDPAQTLAAAFHDIATPCFAHVVDFVLGDHMKQESTESRTREMILGSGAIRSLLDDLGLGVDDVADYHRYPIADNDPPGLSADRLEYTLGNLLNYGRRDRDRIGAYLDDLKAGINEEGKPELVFRDADTAVDFALGALEMGKIYVSDEDRFAMEMLAEILKEAMSAGVITMDDLWTTEEAVIARLERDHRSGERWDHFRGYYQVRRGEGTVIHAKKRYIDPFVENRGRVSEIFGGFKAAADAFMDESQDEPVSGSSYRDGYGERFRQVPDRERSQTEGDEEKR